MLSALSLLSAGRRVVSRFVPCLLLLGWFTAVPTTHGQTPTDITKLIDRLVQLDSIDLAKEVKYRPGLQPSLHAFDADESAMKVLKNPYEVQGRNEPGAAGWYRVSFVVPEKLGKFAIPAAGYNLGVESNCLGSWEVYTYKNGKPAGSAAATGVTGFWTQGNMLANARQPPTAWMSNAPLPCKAGDQITLAILVTPTPLGRGSPEGFALRQLRLRFALAHTFSRQPFYASLHNVHAKLSTLQEPELKAFQEKIEGPLARLDALSKAADTEQLGNLTNAMKAATKEINDVLNASK